MTLAVHLPDPDCGRLRHINPIQPRSAYPLPVAAVVLQVEPRLHLGVNQVGNHGVKRRADKLEEAELRSSHVCVLLPVAQRRDGDAELALVVPPSVQNSWVSLSVQARCCAVVLVTCPRSAHLMTMLSSRLRSTALGSSSGVFQLVLLQRAWATP